MNTTSTQVQHPWRTTLRTIVWLLIALVPTVPTLWGIVQDEVTKAGLTLPPNLAATVGIGVAIIVTVVGIVQRAVLIPGVSAVIAKIPGLSPTPLVIPGEVVGPVIDVVTPSTTAGADVIVHDPGNGDAPTTTTLS